MFARCDIIDFCHKFPMTHAKGNDRGCSVFIYSSSLPWGPLPTHCLAHRIKTRTGKLLTRTPALFVEIRWLFLCFFFFFSLCVSVSHGLIHYSTPFGQGACGKQEGNRRIKFALSFAVVVSWAPPPRQLGYKKPPPI